MQNKLFSVLLALVILATTFVSCEGEKDPIPPEFPPYESMTIDFNNAENTTKSAASTSTIEGPWNYLTAGVTVGYWSAVLGVTLFVPVETFNEAFLYEENAVYLGDDTWEWKYELDIFGITYSARLVSTVQADEVQWEMFIAVKALLFLGEFKWFEGISATDGSSGNWTFYYSPELPEEVLNINWKVEGEEIGEARYTYVLDADNGEEEQLLAGSYLEYGLKDAYFDAFFNIHYMLKSEEADGFKDVFVESSSADFSGRIKALHYFQDEDWHCWDSFGLDTVCEE